VETKKKDESAAAGGTRAPDAPAAKAEPGPPAAATQ
jgi:hypothetical protein